jgi:hypothetical protein
MDPTAQLKALGIKTTADITKGKTNLSPDVIKASDQRLLDGYLARQKRVDDPDFKQAEQAAYDQTRSALNNRPDEIFDDRLKSNQFINGRDYGQIDPHQAGVNRAIDDLRKVTPPQQPKSDFDSNLSTYSDIIGSIFNQLI